MRFRNLLIIALCSLIAVVAYGFLGRIEQSREADPSGTYFAVWSHSPYRYLPIVGLGTGSDSPCFVKIVDRAGRSYGEIPVGIMQATSVDWHRSGAEIKLVGEWDFTAGTCFYWSEDQERRIYTK